MSFHGRDLGRAPAALGVSFRVKLPLRNRAELEQLTILQATPSSPLFGHFLSVAQFRARYGPAPATIARAVRALGAEGFRVTEVDSQSLVAVGTAAAAEAAFGVRMHALRDERGRVRAATLDAVRPRPELAALGATVLGLRDRPRRRANVRLAMPLNRQSTLGNYWFTDLKEAYEYPEYQVGSGKGVTIATVGISDFSDHDADAYFRHERLGSGNATYLAPQPTYLHTLMPNYTPFNPSSPDSTEADLDVQQAGGSASGATIIGIATDGSDAGFVSAYTNIDEKKAGYAAQIVSTSYGECELMYTAAYNDGVDETSTLTEDYHDAFVQGNAEGITFVTSSGDNAGLDCPQAGYFGASTGANYLDVAGVEADADDPNVVAVGGTNLVTSHVLHSAISTYVSENSYDDTIGTDDPYGTGNQVTNELWGSGGGASKVFTSKPSYQTLVTTGISSRAVPDVSMHMGGCPSGAETCAAQDSAVYMYLGGSIVAVIGTSAASPDFAGLLALRLARTGTGLGNANAFLYNVAATNNQVRSFRQGIPGNDGVVTIKAGTLGWNQINGLGTPFGEILADEQEHPYAGIPQTATNP